MGKKYIDQYSMSVHSFSRYPIMTCPRGDYESEFCGFSSQDDATFYHIKVHVILLLLAKVACIDITKIIIGTKSC